MIVGAPIAPQHREQLRERLATMNADTGLADPDNSVLPFGKFDALHTARFVMIEDPSLGDRIEHARSYPVHEPDWLIFLAVCDGSADRLVTDMERSASKGLASLFCNCIGFDPEIPIGQWMSGHRLKPDASYRNWPGRSMLQIREEAALHHALLKTQLANREASLGELNQRLREVGRSVPLTPIPRPSITERVANCLSFLSLPVAALLLAPILLILLLPFLIILRLRETSDPVLAHKIDRERNNALMALEDHDITNPYSAVGSRKPGPFYFMFSKVALWVINWGARHIYSKGRLARVNTIHFANWVFLDSNRRLLFASVYDGSREAYNDDFINKVAFGLNLSFTSALGYPRTRWALFEGARHEEDFKRYLAHHQIPTQVWYKAFPNLSTYDLARNARIRAGLERPLKGTALRRWIAEI